MLCRPFSQLADQKKHLMPLDPENAHRAVESLEDLMRSSRWPSWLPKFRLRSRPEEKVLQAPPTPRRSRSYPNKVVDIVSHCDIIHDYFGEGERPMVCQPVEGVTGESFERLEDAVMAMSEYIYAKTERYGPEWGCVFGEDQNGKAMPSVLVTQNLVGSMGACLVRLENLMTFPVLGALHSHPGRKGLTYSRTGPSDGDQMTADSVAEGYGRPYRTFTVDLPSGRVETYTGTPGRTWERDTKGLYLPVGHSPENELIGTIGQAMV